MPNAFIDEKNRRQGRPNTSDINAGMGIGEDLGFKQIPQAPITLEQKKYQALKKAPGQVEEEAYLNDIFKDADPKRFDCEHCEKELREPSFYDLTNWKAEEHLDGTIILHPLTAVTRFTLVWLQGAGNHCYRAKWPFTHGNSIFPQNVKIIIPVPPKKVKEYITAPNFWVDAKYKEEYKYYWKEDPIETEMFDGWN